MKYQKRFKNGIKRIYEKKILLLVPTTYLIILGMLTYAGKITLLTLEQPFSSNIFGYIFIAFMFEMALIGEFGIITLVGKPIKTKETEKALADVGIIDKAGNSPMLLSRRKNNNGIVLEFYSTRIPLAEYEKHKEEIETALNIKIVSLDIGKDMRHVIIKAVSSFNDKNDIICWNDKYLSNKDFEIILGESYFGTESIDISVTPHILIGGGSGSGKSKLLKLILMESIKKGAKVYLADFKGGVDYPIVWHKFCDIITEREKLDSKLSYILEEMEERRKLLIESQTTNIGEYNEKTDSDLPRIIVACDEISEVLDKTGLGKEKKALVGKVESKLSTIARLGRAFGIHLVIATQRPDADVLKGQIKSNTGYRVCGRADEILSKIILDNTDGAEMISPNDQGIFFTNTRILFKAYYVEDNCLEGVYKDNGKNEHKG